MEKLLGLSGTGPAACLGRPGHPILHAGSTSNMFNWSQITSSFKSTGLQKKDDERDSCFTFFSHI